MIERIPDGVYRAEWYVHDDGIDHDLERDDPASRSRSPATAIALRLQRDRRAGRPAT